MQKFFTVLYWSLDQLLESEVKAKSKPQPVTTVQDCQFYGVKWDAQAVSAIQTVADGLVANAQALGKLADVFKSQSINIECLFKVEGK